MPRYSVLVDACAYYVRTVAVPRSAAIAGVEAAYDHACAAGYTVDPDLAGWDLYEDRVGEQYGRCYDHTPPGDATHIHVQVVARVSACRTVHVDAPNEDDAYVAANGNPEAELAWPRIVGEWQLETVQDVEVSEAECLEEEDA